MHRRPSVMIVASVAATGLLASTSVASAQTTRTVCASGCQYTSINTAIDEAQDGDLIQLAAETYFEGSPIRTDGKAITLRGTIDSNGSPTSILDGADQHRVIVGLDDEDASTIFVNLIVQNGAANCSAPYYCRGGGMFLMSSSPSITNCVFRDNNAVYGNFGGGIFARNGSSPILTRCDFYDNYGSSGAAICVYDAASILTMNRCRFWCNQTNAPYESQVESFESMILGGCNCINSGCVQCDGGDFDTSFPGDLDGDGDYDEDDIRLGMADFGITGGTPGDMDGDEDADVTDFTLLRDQIGVEALGCVVADINGDGEVDGADFAYVLGYWGVCTAP